MHVFVYISLESSAKSQRGSEIAILSTFQEPTFSFIANMNGHRIVEKSILSIEDIGDELGSRFEIIIPVDSSYRNMFLMRSLSGKVENLRLMQFDRQSHGFQKSVMQKASSGSYTILFNPDTVYDITFADMIHNFCRYNSNQILYSEMLIIPSSIFNRSGTWRDLSKGEDIDLLARVMALTDVVVYNPPERVLAIESNEPVVYGSGKLPGNIRSLYSLLNKQRDQIIALNYKWNDISLFLRLEGKKSILKEILIGASFVLSKFSSQKPYGGRDNNYARIMDKILESLIIQDYKRFAGFNGVPKLSVGSKDLEFLKINGKVWGKTKAPIESFVQCR